MANTTVNIDVRVQTKSIEQLEQELQQAESTLKGIKNIGSDAFKSAAKEAQTARKALEKATAAAEGFTSEQKFQAADGAIKLLGGSLAGVVGTLGLLGVESEAFGEFEKKAASAIAVAVGFKDIGEGISQLGPLLGKAGAAVKGFSLSTRAALIATGVGAFVVAIGTIVAYWEEITDAVTDFGKKVPFVGKALDSLKAGFDAIVDAFRPVLEFLGILPTEAERANQAIIESNEALIESGERELALLEARGAKEEEIFAKKKEMLEAELDNLKRNEGEKEEIYAKETELLVLQAKEEKRIADERKAQRDKEAEERRIELEKKKEEAEAEKQEALDAEAERLQSLEDLRNEYKTRAEDQAAVTREQEIELEKERALQELEALGAEQAQKNEVILYYDNLLKEAQDEAAEVAKEEADAARQEELQGIAESEQRKLDLKKQSLQTLSELFGQETALGKAALLAKQAILVQELIAEAKGLTFKAQNAVTEATIDGAKAGSAIAAGTAETAKVGFPQNIPLLIGFAAQAVGIISAVKKAVQTTKSVAGVGGPSLSGIAAPDVSAAAVTTTPDDLTTTAPQTFTTTPTVRAFVLSGDVTSNQEADNKLSTKRTLI